MTEETKTKAQLLAKLEQLHGRRFRQPALNMGLAELCNKILAAGTRAELADLVLDRAVSLTGSAVGFFGCQKGVSHAHVVRLCTREPRENAQGHGGDGDFEEVREIWEWVRTRGTGLLTNDAADDERTAGTLLGFQRVLRLVAAPVLEGDAIVGQMAVANASRDYAGEDLACIEGLCSLYALGASRLEAAEALRDSEYDQRRILEASNEGVWIVDAQNRVVFANRKLADMMAYDVDALIGKPLLDLWDPDCASRAAEMVGGFRQGTAQAYDLKLRRKDGGGLWTLVSVSPLRNRQGRRTGSLGMVTDITERKQAETQVKAALEEKVILLREIHHRVKNNLQVVISLLRLQEDKIQDARALQAFKESEDRVRTMAHIHEALHRSDNLAEIDLQQYIRRLSESLFHGYQAWERNIDLRIEGDAVVLGVDDAVPCGLALNELLSNALKYAFPGSGSGTIGIETRSLGADVVEIRITDTGVGLSEPIDFHSGRTLGLSLVRGLVESQLGGTLEYANKGGAQFTIRFKRSDPGAHVSVTKTSPNPQAGPIDRS